MKIVYSPTYQLNDDMGFSSPIGLPFDNIDDLKEQIFLDYSSDDYTIASINIIINDIIALYFDFPNLLKIFYYCDDLAYQIGKFEGYGIPELIHYMEEYADYRFI